MISFETKDWWTLLWDKLFLWNEVVKNRICLCTTKWEMMNYWEFNSEVVSFPGEYDIQDISIKCIDAWDLLHYVVQLEDSRIAILQSSAALEKENIEGIDQRIVLSEEVKKDVENMELEWEITIIE